MSGSRPEMIEALSEPGAYPPPVDRVERVETHISWVFLAGDYAYKFKKPLDLGFLDFRERDRRLHFCREELRLNGRLAPEIYLDIVGAARTRDGWRVGPLTAQGEPAVRMRRFPDDARLDRVLAAGKLDGELLAAFAGTLAGFQRTLPPAHPGDGFGDAATVARPALENFRALPRAQLDDATCRCLDELQGWTQAQATALADRFASRLAGGFIREGHGDLHLGNLVMLDGRVAAFDGIEFDPALRWIDIQSEVAFLLMDLESRGHGTLGWSFYNAWLAALGDHDGIGLLNWYLVYRHMVRAKIDGIRLSQGELSPRETARLRSRQAAHIELAAGHANPPKPLMVLMHGLSGSGKSRLARRLAPRLPAAWVRSDQERKRLHGLAPDSAAPAAVGGGLYSADATERTYARLAEIARGALSGGVSIVVDAAFLESERREQFIDLATECGGQPVVLSCEAPEDLLRQRVTTRRGDPSDAGVAVLESQLAQPTGIGPREEPYRLTVDTSSDPDIDALLERLQQT